MSHRANRIARPSFWFAAVALGGAALALWALAAGAAAPAGDAAKGQTLYAKSCAACHGAKAEGMRSVNSPALHQQEPWYIVAQLQKFKAGIRGAHPKDVNGAAMRPMAMTIPDEQATHDLAAYITSLEGGAPKPEVKGDAAAGKAHYAKVCAACHGDNARGKPELKSPALVGQNDWYVVAQLEKFKSGLRGADPKDVTGQQMKGVVATLPDEQALKDVAAYIATLK